MRHGHRVRWMLMVGLFALLAFAAGVSLPGTAKLGLGGPAMAQDGFAIDQFYDELAPYGAWVHHPRHNYVWVPRSVAPGWRPYTIGQWLSTDQYGWYWESYEPFAWAVYHYGRWGYDHDYGWYWVPGDTWAPAWVQWRYGTDYVGWAPVGPSPYGGYAYGGPTGYAPPPPLESWIFVRQPYLMSNVVYRHVLPRNDVYIALNHTTYVVRPEYRNGHVYNYGMPRDRWSQITRQRIKPHKIHRGNRKAHPHGWNGRHGRDLYAYAPHVRKGVKPRRAPKRVHHRSPKAKAKYNGKHRGQAATSPAFRYPAAKYNGKHRGRAATSPAFRYPATPTARPGNARAHPGMVYPGRRGPGAAVVNPRVRPKAGAGKRKAHKSHPAKSKAARSKAARSKAAKSKAAKARAARARTAKAKAARAKTAKARPAKSRNAKAAAAKGKAARSKTAKAKAARSKAARAKAPRAKAVGTAKTRPAKAKPAKSKAAKARPPNAKGAKAKAVKARSANAKPGAGRGGRGSGGPGARGKGKKGGGGNRAAACKANPRLPFCGRRG